MTTGPQPKYDPEYVRDVSVAVYKSRLYDGDRELKEQGEEDFRKTAGSYDSLTRSYLDAINTIGLQEKKL
jgi:hypothetical protein